MPLIYKPNDNLFDTQAEALVNTVNCVGVMGKGLALLFREYFPESSRKYRIACQERRVVPGVPYLTSAYDPHHKYVIHFPTKDHWNSPSQIDWVDSGCAGLRSVILAKKIKSIAVPRLGCANGGLLWTDVNPIIVNWLGDLDDTIVEVYGEDLSSFV